MEKITYKLKLPLDKVSDRDESDLKKQVGDYLVEAILKNVSEGKSPVQGGGWTRKISTPYKKIKSKYSSKLYANMELHGDMLDALKYEPTEDGIEIGIFDETQVPKADGHNNFSGKSKLPERRFIPKEDQKFKKDILQEVATILTNFTEKD